MSSLTKFALGAVAVAAVGFVGYKGYKSFSNHRDANRIIKDPSAKPVATQPAKVEDPTGDIITKVQEMARASTAAATVHSEMLDAVSKLADQPPGQQA